MSDRGHSPVAAAQLKREAETRSNQIQRIDTSAEEPSDLPAEYASSFPGSPFADGENGSAAETHGIIANRVTQPTSTQPTDEASVIEERRKRREAIKARYRGQATPLLVQTLALDTASAPSTPKSTVMPEENPGQGKLCWFRLTARTDT